MNKIVVLTGAGISADSGLKTFRDGGGLWEGQRIEDVATPAAFARHPQKVLDFYNTRRRQMLAAQPNAAHTALAQLEAAYDVAIITQNVDNLHERAGSSHVLHLHGELTKARSSVDENHVVECLTDQTLADVDAGGHLMRPFIVWFGEAVPLIDTAMEWMAKADKVLVVGTSMKVYPAAGLLQYAPASAPVCLVDPHPPTGFPGIDVVSTPAKDGVPTVVAQWLAQASSARAEPH